MYRVLGAFCFLLFCCRMGCAQDFNFEAQREQLLSLDGKWRFHTGDDPRWADPKFDDSHWSLLDSDRTWAGQGYKGYTGFAWYRFHVQDLGHGPIALLLPIIVGSYQVFADGQLIGERGKLPPRPTRLRGQNETTFPIPVHHGLSDLRIALRVWRDPRDNSFFGGGPLEASFLGRSDLIAERYRARELKTLWGRIDENVLALLQVLAGLTALGLYFLIGTAEYEYLWYALAQLLDAALTCLIDLSFFYSVPDLTWEAVGDLADVQVVFRMLFFYRVLGAQRTPFFWLTLFAVAIHPVVSVLEDWSVMGFAGYLVITAAMALLYYSWTIQAAWQGAWRGLVDAKLLLVPLFLDGTLNMVRYMLGELPALGIQVPKLLLPFTEGFALGPFHLTFVGLSQLLVLFAALAILVGRFAHTRRGEDQRARELDAARIVQHVLTPQETPPVPGFEIASFYQPIEQVGGDFFQIIPVNTGVLIAIGDVSGKGLPAAMTVSLIVGALRMVAEETTSPAVILHGLNQALLSRGGSTTCLLAWLEPNGTGLLANAGHMPLYRNGEEVETAVNRPLGLADDSTYSEAPLTLRPNDCLTFVSDGVVEANKGRGELFGLARGARSAENIARAAKEHGQEDDITVLTVAYRPLAMA